MNKNLFKNNASSILNVGLGSAATELSVTAGSEVLFPFIDETGDYFMSTIVDTTGNFEIVKVVATNANIFTIERAQENTVALTFPVGSVIEMRLTAGSLEQLRDIPVATDISYGTVRLATQSEIDTGADGALAVSASVLKEQAIINVQLLKQMPQLFTGTFDRIYPVGKDGVTDTDWQICDGTNGTPDLRGLFIKGGDGTNTGELDRDPANTIISNTGDTTLTEAQLPTHTHVAQPVDGAIAGTGVSGGSCNRQTGVTDAGPYGYVNTRVNKAYSTTASYFPGDQWTEPYWTCYTGGVVYPDKSSFQSGSTGLSESHNHSLNITKDDINVSPPYYTLAYIMYIGE